MINLVEIYKTLLTESDVATVSINMYILSCETETGGKIIYEGPDLDRAEREYNIDPFFDKSESLYEHTILLQMRNDVYKYIGSDDIVKYPISDWYDDPDCYELIEEGEYDYVKSRVISGVNNDSTELLDDVDRYYNSEYGGWKYHKIKIVDSDDNMVGSISLRIADHTENINNHGRFDSADYYISVVISDYDSTRDRFGIKNTMDGQSNEYEFHFDSQDDLDRITGDVDDKIDEFRKKILSAA